MSGTPHSRARLAALAGSSAVLAAGMLLLAAVPASAHVRADGDASPGSSAVVTFRVPTESATASTTSLTVTLPTDTPITSVRPRSKPGWTAEVTKVRLDPPVVDGDLTIASAVGSITWTATDGGIPPGEFDEFVVQLGPIPDADELVMPALQGYGDGTSVDWSEVGQGGTEPEHPAPVLRITRGTAEPATADPGAATLGIAGLSVGAAGLIVAVVALVAAARGLRRR